MRQILSLVWFRCRRSISGAIAAAAAAVASVAPSATWVCGRLGQFSRLFMCFVPQDQMTINTKKQRPFSDRPCSSQHQPLIPPTCPLPHPCCCCSTIHVPPYPAPNPPQDLSPIQMMFVMTAFSTIFSFVTLVHQDELVPFFAFVSDHPEIHLHFVAFGVCSTIGQLLIFHTIRSFGAVVFAIIMTVR